VCNLVIPSAAYGILFVGKFEGVIPPIPDDFEPVEISDEKMAQLIELDIKTRRQAFAQLELMDPTEENPSM